MDDKDREAEEQARLLVQQNRDPAFRAEMEREAMQHNAEVLKKRTLKARSLTMAAATRRTTVH